MREAHDGEVSSGQCGQELGELPAGWGVDALKEPPVPGGGQPHVIVGQAGGPAAAQDGGRSGVVGGVVTTEKRVGGQVGVEDGQDLGLPVRG